jgi:hypothetical protein
MKNPIYTTFGTLVIILVSWAGYRGWSMTSIDEVRNVPKSVRDNPGSYRSIYYGYSRYIGGK